ncbi:hypothetical protein DPMN_184605 [Dreissena polymorpha]|uniref:Uncharacterized protein n=1 Tax=Dreissena polymorpha TaxID=45954 RepID=A0A9D4DIV8_DREPO|nr:hypothetical protein DPMN_184605 [Dreissena polymorpha]
MAAGLVGVRGRAAQSHVEQDSSCDRGHVPARVLPYTEGLVRETRRHLLCV